MGDIPDVLPGLLGPMNRTPEPVSTGLARRCPPRQRGGDHCVQKAPFEAVTTWGSSVYVRTQLYTGRAVSLAQDLSWGHRACQRQASLGRRASHVSRSQTACSLRPVNLTGPMELLQFDHGQSNPTYYIRLADRQLVLRKKPSGTLLPSAHAIEREFR